MATKTNKEVKATVRRAQKTQAPKAPRKEATKRVGVRKTTVVKTISTRKRNPGILTTSGITSKLNLVRLTRNEQYLPNDYKLVLEAVRDGYVTTRELAELNPLKRKARPKYIRQYYYHRVHAMADIGLLEKERHAYHNGITCIVENRYIPVELEPVKLGPGQFLDVNIRL